jgi:hypothetical protein
MAGSGMGFFQIERDRVRAEALYHLYPSNPEGYARLETAELLPPSFTHKTADLPENPPNSPCFCP